MKFMTSIQNTSTSPSLIWSSIESKWIQMSSGWCLDGWSIWAPCCSKKNGNLMNRRTFWIRSSSLWKGCPSYIFIISERTKNAFKLNRSFNQRTSPSRKPNNRSYLMKLPTVWSSWCVWQAFPELKILNSTYGNAVN